MYSSTTEQYIKFAKIEPVFDGISTAVTTYKVTDHNGNILFIGNRNDCLFCINNL